MYSFAYGFFESESKESWTWFLLQLRKAIGELPLLAIYCDASKGLIGAVKDVFSHAEMRECFKHLMQNYIKLFTGQEHMYPIARAYRPKLYEHHNVNVVTIDGPVHWLKEHRSLL
jgi:transposase-like protein